MIYAFTLLLVGSLLGQYYPLNVRGWMWGAFDFVRGVSRGKAATAPEPVLSAPNQPLWRTETAREKPGALTAAGNIAKFFAGCVGFAVKHPVLCIGVALLAIYLLVIGPRLPFGWGQSADDLRVEMAEADAAARKKEADNAVYAGERGDETQRRERAIQDAVETGQQDLENAALQIDPSELFARYEFHYNGLLPHAGGDAGDAHSAPDGPDPVRRAPADAA